MYRVEHLSGWGNYPVVKTRVLRPEQHPSLRTLVEESSRPLLARGAGRSYGDAALNEDGATVLTTRLNRMLSFDAETGVLRAEAGVRLREILETFVPRGWFLPVTPGTKDVTLGGAVAFDVHGKNHPQDGGFSTCVRELRLLLASGEEVICSRETRPDLFRATVSGAGLTGIITEVELELRPIDTAYLVTRTVKSHSLDETFSVFEKEASAHRYGMAWIDCLASGSEWGRGVLTFGDHADRAALPPPSQGTPLHYTPNRTFSLPVEVPSGILTAAPVKAFNRLYFARQEEGQRVQDLDSFFYPLDAIGHWNRAYGSKGFVQYQCVLPRKESHEGIEALLRRLKESRHDTFLAVLKRLGPADGGMLSFPMRGYTLALDVPRRPGLASFLEDLNEVVTDCGGRVYLAKDAHLSADTFREMYPSVDTWLEVKRRIDPQNRFRSLQGDRLKLHP